MPAVSTLMSSPPVTAAADESLAIAAGRMAELNKGAVVVVDDTGGVVGVLTERDVTKASAAGVDPRATKVSEWMTADPVTMPPDTDAAVALDELIKRGFRHLPIVEAGKLVGVTSMRGLVPVVRLATIRPEAMGGTDLLTEEQQKTRAAEAAASGLEKVVAAETELSDIDGQRGRLSYRGYNAVDLAFNCSFEAVWHTFLRGELPSPEELAAFQAETVPYREIPESMHQVLRDVAHADSPPMDALRTATSALATQWGVRPWLDLDDAEIVQQATRFVAVLPSLVAAIYRIEQGLEPVAPDPELGHAANYLWMLFGERPTDAQVTGVERYLILTADHGMNASTFTARVVTSTGSDLGSAVTAAIGALAGPLHGGAPSRVLDTLDDIGTPENAEAWMRAYVQKGERLMGFGHRVYKTEDPRAAALRETGAEIGGPRFVLAKAAEDAALKILHELKPGRALYTNVEYYSAIVLEEAGLPRQLFTPTFASSRIVGWTAQILEQTRNNRLIRPGAHYHGPENRELPDWAKGLR